MIEIELFRRSKLILASLLTTTIAGLGCGVELDDEEGAEELELQEVEQGLAAPTSATDVYMASLSGTISASRTVSWSYRIGNNSLSTSAASSVSFYASTDAAFGSDDLARPLGSARSIPSLRPGQLYFTQSGSATWPAGFGGVYIVYAITNNDGITSNNRGAFQLRTDLTVEPITAVRSGSTITVNYAAKNAAGVPSPASVTRVRIIGSATPVLMSCSDSMPALAAGARFPASGTRRLSCAVPSGARGNYVEVTVDYNKTVIEANETNNVSTAWIAPLGPYFEIGHSTGGTTKTGVDRVIGQIFIRNAGTVSAGATHIGLYVSSGLATGTQTLLCNYPVPALGVGAGVNVTVSCPVASTVPRGLTYTQYMPDNLNTVVEANETNKFPLYSRRITIGADITVESVFGTLIGTNLIRVSYKMINRGTKVIPATRADVHLSRSDFNIDAADPRICQISVPTMNPGTEIVSSMNCSVPSTWPRGENMLRILPDSTSVVSEAVEGDYFWGFVTL